MTNRGTQRFWKRLAHNPGQTLSDGLVALRDFFTRRIWLESLRDMRPMRAFGYRVSRLAYSTARAWTEHSLPYQAAALTYYTFLSIVPFLALAFATLKGFGLYTRFVDGMVRPYLDRTFGENLALREQLDQLLSSVDGTETGNLGTFGLLTLAYTAMSLLGNVEGSLNALWGAKQRRPLVRQVTDYLTIVIVTPILIFSAVTLGAMARSSKIVLFLQKILHLNYVIDFFMQFTSLATACLGLFAFFILMPNVRTRVVSALLGGVVAGVLWQLALFAYVDFQVGVAKYSALYATFGAIPIFLAWIYVSWLIVLLGAALAASHQNEQTVRQRLRARDVDQSLKERIAVAVVARIVRDFLHGAPRPSSARLADAYEVPALVVDEVLDELAKDGVVAKTVCGNEVTYVPGRDIDATHVRDLLAALRRDPRASEIEAGMSREVGDELNDLLRGMESEAEQSPHNITLRALAALVPQHARDDAPEHRAAEASRRDVRVDGKQPEVPA